MARVVDRLLAAIEAAPEDAGGLIATALDARGWSDVREAVTDDPRFIPWLVPAFRDPRVRREIPYLSRLCVQHGLVGFRRSADGAAEMVPDLIAVWRSDDDAQATNAGFALLELGRADGGAELLRVLSSDLDGRSGVALTIGCRAAFTLRPGTEAFDRVGPLLADDDCARAVWSFVASEGDGARVDPRWAVAAAEAVERRGADVAREARRALEVLGGDAAVQQALSARESPAEPVRSAVSDAEVARARARVTRALGALADAGIPLRPAVPPEVLDHLESLVGPLPPAVRALYEVCDGLRVEGQRPHAIHPIAVAVEAAERWIRTERPGERTGLARPFELPIAPDATTLRGLSGGPDLAVVFPWDAADPPLRHAPRSPRFSTWVARAVSSAREDP